MAKLWQTFTQRADREGWPSARLLATLAERSSDAAQQTLGLPLQPIRQAQPVGRAAIIARTFSCLYRSGAMKPDEQLILIAMVCGLSGCAVGYGGYGGGYGGGYEPAYYGSNYLGFGGGYDYYSRRPPPYVYQQRQFHQQQATPRPAAPPPSPAAKPPSPEEVKRLLNQSGIRY